MKKLTAFLLSAGILFSLTACSSSSKVEDNALDAFEKVVNKIVEMKTATYKASVDTETEDGEKVNLTLSGAYLADSANPSFSAVLKMTSGTESYDNFMEFYLKDNMLYMSMLGMKQKGPMTDMKEAGIIPDVDEETFQLDKEAIKPYLKTAKLDGSKLTLEFDSGKFNQLVKDNEDVTNSLTNGAETTYKKALLEIELKDDFASKILLDMEAEQKSDTETKKIDGTITLEFTDINTKKEITFPDFSNYTEAQQ